MSNTHCRFCNKTVKGLYLNCPICGTNLMHPEEAKTAPENYELAEGQVPDEILRLTTNLIQAADKLAAAFHEALKPIIDLYSSLPDDVKLKIAEQQLQREGKLPKPNDNQPIKKGL